MLRARLGLLASWPVALALSISYGLTLAPGVTWANDGGDSGDLLTAVATGGVPHPTGYPTYLLLARLFLLLPLGEQACQQTMLSAICAIAAALGVAAIVRAQCPAGSWPGALAGVLAALWLGWSPLVWSQAVIAEIYSLHLLFCAGLWWYATLRSRPAHPSSWGWPDRTAGLTAGLALGNHLTALFPALGALGFVVLCSPRGGRLRRLGALSLWAGLGLLVYLSLPLRAGAGSPASWGDPRTLEGLRWIVSGELYHRMALGASGGQIAGRLSALAALPISEFGPVGLCLGLWGLLRGAARLPQLSAAMGLTALATAGFALTYGSRDAHVYLLPISMLIAVWVGVGATGVLAHLQRRPPIAALAAAALVASAALGVPAAARAADSSGDWRAILFAAETLAEAPVEAVLLTSEDYDTFPLWYYHVALGARPDLAVVSEPLLPFDWYRAHLRAAYPSLRLPAGLPSGWGPGLLALNEGRPFCWTQPHQDPPLRCKP